MHGKSPRLFRVLGFLLLLAGAACDNDPSGRESDGLPPDPGEQGRATVEGIDSDNDGIRDDVQRHIVLTYDDPATQDALFQVAEPQLASLVQAGDRQRVLELTEEMVLGVTCLYAVNSPGAARDALMELEAVMLNTRDRIRASIQADAQAGGETFTLPAAEGTDACEER